ncbi:MAG: response regulator transcription factor [Geobacter sp.]|nr:response regulator transcription factor [Geobacter sp.]
MHLLVVEDERKIAEALRSGLEAEGYEVTTAASGEEGYFCLTTDSYDLMLLDLMLPGRDGMEILRTVRSKGITTPILVLTGRDTVEDRVLGLDSGADDYLVKPFAFPELLARIRLLLRRGVLEPQHLLKIDDLELDLLAHRAIRSGQTLDLTVKEFELLAYLLRHRGHVVSREMLAREVWQVHERSTPLDNVIDVNMARLRRKVDGPFDRKLIRTLRGVGFCVGEPVHG